MIPRMAPQSALVQPDALHLAFTLTWVRRADHSIGKLSLLDRPNGQQLALAVGPMADWRSPLLLGNEVRAALMNGIEVAHREYINQDPF